MRKLILPLFIFSSYLILFFTLIIPVYAQGYPDEQITSCETLTKRCNSSSDGDAEDKCGYVIPPDYIDKKGIKNEELRSSAGLNFDSAVRGTACGEVKSSPIVLEEVVTYPGPDKGDEWETCVIDPAWGGEITMNYDFTGNPERNLYIPFAQEMGDEWAGILDTEHMTVEDYNALMARAGIAVNDDPEVTPTVTPALDPEDMLLAQNEIRLKSGVLRKLLPEESQDELKCNFAKWVAKNYNALKPTLYADKILALDFKPDDKVPIRFIGGVEGACRQEACPASKLGDLTYNQGKCREDYDSGKMKFGPAGKQFAPGPAWKKMGLIPNERSRGQIKYYVCGDKRYDQRPDYGEVMRMGLAANELFRIFTDKGSQDRFYKQFPDLAGNPLKNMLPPGINADRGDDVLTEDQDGLQVQNELTNNTEEPTQEEKTAVIINNPSARTEVKQKPLTAQQKFVNDITSRVKQVLPKVEAVLAKTVEIIKANKTGTERVLAENIIKKKPVLLAQASDCAPLEMVYEVIPGDEFNYKVIIRRTECGKKALPGLLGHIRLYLDYPDSPSPQENYLSECNQDRSVCGELGYTPDMIPWLPRFKNGTELEGWLNSGGLRFRADPFNIPPTPFGGQAVPTQPGTSLAGKCDPTAACCYTPDCGPATCAPCKRTQIGPSKTSVWPQGYPASHSMLGVDWGKDYSAEQFNDPVIYSFKPTKADCTFDPIKDEDGLFTNCVDTCSGGLSCNDGKCGTWSCSRSHDRVVNVYSNVPYLGSTWMQTADPTWGFMSAIKPTGQYGAGTIPTDFSGCTDDQNLIFDQFGNYVPQHGAESMLYGFNTMKTFPKNADSIEISMKSGQDGRILFYRLGGVCNANKWWTEKVLNPMLEGGLTSAGLQQNLGLITICAQKGVTISITKYYNSQCNESAVPLPGFIQGNLLLQGQNGQ